MCLCGCCRYVDFCMGRVELLRRNGVVPVIVFDGGRLPMKAGEEGARQRYYSLCLRSLSLDSLSCSTLVPSNCSSVCVCGWLHSL